MPTVVFKATIIGYFSIPADRDTSAFVLERFENRALERFHLFEGELSLKKWQRNCQMVFPLEGAFIVNSIKIFFNLNIT